MNRTRRRERRTGAVITVSVVAGVLAASLTVGLTTGAQAAGLFLYEMGTPDLGTASAGRAAGTDNAATAFGNPAAMTRLDQSQMLVGIQPAYGITHFDKDNETTVSGGNGGNSLGFIPGLGGYYVYSATPDLKFGLSLGSDFGLSGRYQSNWSGRYYVQQVELVTLGAFPVVAYRINPWLSIGGGAQIIYGKLNYKTGINDIFGGGDASIDVSSQDVGYGGIAGILIEPADGTRFGVTYTSQVKLDFKEKPTTNNLGPGLQGVFDATGLTGAKVDLGLTIPNQVMVSGHHDLTPELAVMGNVVWQQWSEFGQPTPGGRRHDQPQGHRQPQLRRHLGLRARHHLQIPAGLVMVARRRLRYLADLEEGALAGAAARPAGPGRHRRAVRAQRAHDHRRRLRVSEPGRGRHQPQPTAGRNHPGQLFDQRDPLLQRDAQLEILSRSITENLRMANHSLRRSSLCLGFALVVAAVVPDADAQTPSAADSRGDQQPAGSGRHGCRGAGGRRHHARPA